MTAAMPTHNERVAFAAMQARLIELLLRHDPQIFRRYYDQRDAYAHVADQTLRRYRDLAVLFHLGDELFEHILPRIRRRLSFEAPRHLLREEPPARGRIDWERTLTSGWDERPGEPPLLLTTRQRRREFATPENLLAVATLLEYREAALRLLWDERSAVGTEALRHPLAAIAERCERELAFPQFAGIRQRAQQHLDSGAIDSLEAAVEQTQTRGSNSAYQDLLSWRRRFRRLELLERLPATADDTLGADPARDAYLYQLWIFFELAEMLRQQGCLERIDTSAGRMLLRFRWQTCRYEVRHDQAVPRPVARWIAVPAASVPGVRPDFYLWRIDPPPHEVRDGETLYWREPGVVWDAKYYRERESERAPSSPIKRMLADLALLGETHAVLLFAFLRATEVDGAAAPPEPFSYTLQPSCEQDQSLVPDQRVTVRQLRPGNEPQQTNVPGILTELLNQAHALLGRPREPRCYGIFLDALGTTAHGVLATTLRLPRRSGDSFDAPVDDLLLCPKPHVGSWRVDIVSRSRDCCANALLCHVKNRPDARKPERLTTLEQVAAALTAAGAGATDEEAALQAATRQVRAIAERYADLIQPDISVYRDWIRERLEIGPLFDTTPLLNTAQRDTLALARFLWEQIEHIRAANYAGPTLLFTGVLEELTHATIFKHSPPLFKDNGDVLMKTLGAIGNSKRYGGRNWRVLEDAIVKGGHWQAAISPRQQLSFSDWVDGVATITTIRNEAAHRARVDKPRFDQLVSTYFGSLTTGFGVLNGLLLAWREEPETPAGVR